MAAEKQWIVRLISLVIILAALFAYQAKALQWEEQTAENRAEIESAEAYNQAVLEARQSAELEETSREMEDSAEPAEEALYADGQYSGTGSGFGGEIVLTVTISGGTVTAIDIDEADGEDDAYFSIAQEILDEILTAQSAEVDTVTGATFSSTGIRDAVQDALDQAKAG